LARRTAAAALTAAAAPASAADTAVGLVIREGHGDTGEGAGAGVVQPATDSGASPASGPAVASNAEAAGTATKRAALAAVAEGDAPRTGVTEGGRSEMALAMLLPGDDHRVRRAIAGPLGR
jgi:hypothetical protein